MSPMRLLVIDDDEAFRTTLANALTEKGHTTFELLDGIGVIDAMIEFQPDVVITDVLMAEYDGVETVRKIRGFDDDVYVVGISGNAFYLQMLLKLGADAVVIKPFQLSRICNCLAEAERKLTGRVGHKPASVE